MKLYNQMHLQNNQQQQNFLIRGSNIPHERKITLKYKERKFSVPDVKDEKKAKSEFSKK